MDDESTGEALLARVAALGLPIVGRSQRGRPIHAGPLPVTATMAHRPVVVMAGIHGDEPASVEAVLDLWDRRAELASPVLHPVWLVPVLNPDGIAAGTKNSARDVDLNRNYPARNFTTAHRPGYDPGPAPASEPETETFVRLLTQLDAAAVVAVHAPFACINFDGPASGWASQVAAASGWPARADIGYPTPGSLGSWFGNDRGMPLLTIELPKGELSSFREPAFRALSASIRFTPEAAEARPKGL
jgi:protein MpaA